MDLTIRHFVVLIVALLLALIHSSFAYTANDIALVGGGSIPQPGEISLAHNGVLFFA